MESGLTFNQLICEFESRRPRQKTGGSRQEQSAVAIKFAIRNSAIRNSLMWAVAQSSERCTVTAAVAG